MRSLIVTVAGLSSRFNEGYPEPVLKCLHTDGDERQTLLWQILEKAGSCGRLIVVGGYKFADLQEFCRRLPHNIRERLTLVFNPKYDTAGSGYSLAAGVQALPDDTDEVVFAEGDLYYTSESFAELAECPVSAYGVNHELLFARKAVAAYLDADGRIKYLYDTSHNLLSIPEPFSAVFNSAQVWKFHKTDLLRRIVAEMEPMRLQGTNLEIIQSYFDALAPGEYCMVDFPVWLNCNTRADYDLMVRLITNQNSRKTLC